ncbi:MAG TPA: DUF1932 domain-containing protein, partial [Steroidobacteraceae bacterium]
LGASRAGVAEALHREMSESQGVLLQALSKRTPDMLPKAYRWVAEMQQIARFVSAEPGASELYRGASELFAHIAADLERDRTAVAMLTGFFTTR